MFRVGAAARLLIVGQAPGRRVHQTGIPWNDPSGDVLRGWLALDRASFYDTRQIAIVGVGLCYPGTVDGADLPPMPQCAPLWQPKFRAAAFREYLPEFFPLPHPSWRNTGWLKANPWFAADVIPALRRRVKAGLR